MIKTAVLLTKERPLRNEDIRILHNNLETLLSHIDLAVAPNLSGQVKEYTNLLIYLDGENADIKKRLAPFARAVEGIMGRYKKPAASSMDSGDKEIKEYSPISSDDIDKLEVINKEMDEILYSESGLVPKPIVSEASITNGLLYRMLAPFIKDAA